MTPQLYVLQELFISDKGARSIVHGVYSTIGRATLVADKLLKSDVETWEHKDNGFVVKFVTGNHYMRVMPCKVDSRIRYDRSNHGYDLSKEHSG